MSISLGLDVPLLGRHFLEDGKLDKNSKVLMFGWFQRTRQPIAVFSLPFESLLLILPYQFCLRQD